MRLIKSFGLAALLTVAAMALIGASSASAESTVLCKVNTNPCPEGSKLEHAHVEGLSTHALLHTNILDVLCTHSLILGEALLLANPLIGHLSLIDFSNCIRVSNGSACEVKTLKTGLLELLKTGTNKGSGKSSGNEVLVKCGSFIHCVYGGTPELSAEGSNAAGTTEGVIKANKAKLTIVSGFLCPEVSEWTATYSIKLPKPVYITS